MRQFLLIAVMFLLQLFGANAEIPVSEKAADFTLQDQYEKTVSLRHYQGRNVVLIASDKEGSRQSAAWTKAIKEKYADRVALQGVADVSGVPFFLKGKIRSDFKKDGESILLDWKGEVFKAYGLTKGESNVLVIDREGTVRHRVSGPATLEAVKELSATIDALN